jgi:MurNAc alpha-1-phosphate uridylyltransferase
VVLAAGRGTRLRPLTEMRPKALCPVNNVPLIDLALASVRPFARDIAVNVHHLADQVRAHLAGTEVHVSDETERLLGSGGALGHLHDWIAGRPVLVRNADTYLTGGLDELLRGWDGRRPRVLGVLASDDGDFGDVRYVGASLIPAADAARLPDAIAGLYDKVWHPADVRGELEVVLADGQFVDCGTPREYLRANLLASGGRSVVGAGAVVEGVIADVVVWDGGWVGPQESLRDCIRVGRDLTIDAH